MSSTALILRPPSAPTIHVLEVDGLNYRYDPIINYTPRTNLPPMSFSEFLELPDHDRNSRYTLPSNQDFESACRIARIVNSYQLPRRHKLEILARLELIFPDCTEGILPTQPNLEAQ